MTDSNYMHDSSGITSLLSALTRPRGYKNNFMINSAEHYFFLLINVKMPTNIYKQEK